jgi:hypothetical protein
VDGVGADGVGADGVGADGVGADGGPLGCLLGRVVRLQVQTEPLKSGQPRRYDPTPLRLASRLEIDTDGVLGLPGLPGRSGFPGLPGTGLVMDVHHASHPRTRDGKARRGVSVMSVADYAWLRANFGPHLTDGVAGESILIDCGSGLAGRDLSTGCVIGDPGPDRLLLPSLRAAAPCAEFARFCLGRADAGVDQEVLAAMSQLEGGRRGFLAVAAGPGRVVPGDPVWLAGQGAPGGARAVIGLASTGAL